MSTRIAIVAPILVLLIVAAAAAIVYFLIYRRRINRSLQEGGEGGAGPEPASVTRSGFIVVLIVAMILMMLRIGGLSSQVGSLSNQLQNQSVQIQSLRYSIDELKAAIDKAESAVADSDYEIRGFSDRNNTAEVWFKIVPARAAENTEVSIAAGEKTVKLAKTGHGTYEGVLTADIFGSYPGEVRALITTDGVTVSENLNYTLDGLWVDFLPQLISDGGGRSEIKSGKLSVTWDSSVYFQSSDYASFDLKSAKLVEEADGKVISEEDISSKLSERQGMPSYSIKVDKKVSYSSSYSLYVTAKDSKGYTHKAVIINLAGSDGVPVTEYPGDQIFDAGGKLLTKMFKE